jgi:hypothetical protein
MLLQMQSLQQQQLLQYEMQQNTAYNLGNSAPSTQEQGGPPHGHGHSHVTGHGHSHVTGHGHSHVTAHLPYAMPQRANEWAAQQQQQRQHQQQQQPWPHMNPWLRGEQGRLGMQGGLAPEHMSMCGITAHQMRSQLEQVHALEWRAQMVTLLSTPEGPDRILQEKHGLFFGTYVHV